MTEKMKNLTVSEPELKIDNFKKNFSADIEPLDYSKSFADDTKKNMDQSNIFPSVTTT